MSASALMSAEEVVAFTNAAFASNLRARQVTGEGSKIRGVSRKITVYYLPDDVVGDERLLALAALTLPGQATSGEVREWQSWVITYVLVAFPELVADMRVNAGGEYQVSVMPDDFLSSVRAAEKVLEEDVKANPAVMFPATFPLNRAPLSAAVYNCAGIPGTYGYCGLLLHLMGKRVTADTRDAITVRRPKNIIDKFKAEQEAYILRGAGRMSDAAHTAVNDAWDQSTAVKRILVPEMARLGGVETQAAEVTFTLFKMLEYSGMQPAALIHSLIAACPWIAEEVPMLRPAYHLYVASVHEYARADPSLRPYLKLIYGDQTRIFHAKSLSDLTACAVLFLKQSETSLSGYTAPGGEKAKALFISAARRHGIDLSGAGAEGAGTDVAVAV